MKKIPHAMLYEGLSGTGKRQAARDFIQAFFCDHSTALGHFCGTCRHCMWMENHIHPSLLWISPEENGSTIKIEQIRQLVDFIHLTDLHEKARFVVIEPLSAVHVSAANALLKSLEEPPKNVYFILIHDETGAPILSTIRSRCQRVYFQSDHLKTSQSVYETVLNGLKRLNTEHPVVISGEWAKAKLELHGVVEALMTITVEKIKTSSSKALSDYWDFLIEIRRVLGEGVHLNAQLVFDVMLVRYKQS